MASRNGEQGGGRWSGTALILAASVRLYGALLKLYPKAFRRRYAPEMKRDFRELSLEGLEEGGGLELARVWASTLSDLLVTALKERGTTLARNIHQPVEPRIVARLTAAIVLVAVIVTMASLIKTPQYEASIEILVGWERGISQDPNSATRLQELTHTMTESVGSRPVAEAVVRQENLEVTPQDFLEEDLSVEQVPNTQFIEVSYTDANPQRAQRVANTVGDVFSKQVSDVYPGANAVTATVWTRAAVPEEPVSPNLLCNGLLALVLGLMLCVGLVFALPRVVASGIGRAVRRGTSAAGGHASGSGETLTGAPDREGAKEREVLEALGRRGKLTVAGVALETSLTVKEADRMLSALAAEGHLEISVEHGRLLYSLWEQDAPS